MKHSNDPAEGNELDCSSLPKCKDFGTGQAKHATEESIQARDLRCTHFLSWLYYFLANRYAYLLLVLLVGESSL